MKRYRSAVVLLLCLLLLFVSCGTLRQDSVEQKENKGLTIFVGSAGASRNYLKAIQEKFPDMDLDITYYAGPNTTEYLSQLREHGEVPDLVIASDLWENQVQEKYLMNLSGYDFANNYKVSFVDKNEIDGQIYLLPSFYNIAAVFYNKTLFEENGWAVPENLEQLEALVEQIRTESNLIPIAFTGIYTGGYFRMMSSCAQAGFLTTPAGEQWVKDFAQGEASAELGFGEGLAVLQKLCDVNAFDASSMKNGDTDTYTQLVQRKAAMAIPVSQQSTFAELLEETTDTFGAMPYYGIKDGSAVLTVSPSFYFGLGKQLETKENEKKLDQALDIIAYFSSEEGQKALQESIADVSPLVQDTEEEVFAPYQDCWNYVESGQTKAYLYSGYEDVVAAGGEAIREMFFENGSSEAVIEAMDETRQAAVNKSSAGRIASVERDYTEEETVQIMADFLLEEGQGDVAIVSAGGCNQDVFNDTGVSGKLQQGDITLRNYNCVLPGNLTGTIVNVTMTGGQLEELLKTGRRITDESGNTGVFQYYLSGADAADLKKDQDYRVSMVSNDFDNAIFSQVEDTKMLVTDAYLHYLEHGWNHE